MGDHVELDRRDRNEVDSDSLILILCPRPCPDDQDDRLPALFRQIRDLGDRLRELQPHLADVWRVQLDAEGTDEPVLVVADDHSVVVVSVGLIT